MDDDKYFQAHLKMSSTIRLQALSEVIFHDHVPTHFNFGHLYGHRVPKIVKPNKGFCMILCRQCHYDHARVAKITSLTGILMVEHPGISWMLTCSAMGALE